jgi:GNAT superfamily N-acetyltransferase
VSGSAGCSCSATGFLGFEGQILRLRNSNREHGETLDYLNWRYQGSAGAPDPRVYWLLDPADRPIGMASAIFRPYSIDATTGFVAVIGDISLDAQWRGRGLGHTLLQFMTAELDKDHSEHPALVIPTESARRTLARVGWGNAGSLAPLIYVLEPSRYLQPLVRNERLARGMARVFQSGTRLLAHAFASRQGSLSIADGPAAAEEFLLRQPALPGVVQRRLSPEALRWRYAQHPRAKFRFATYARSGSTNGLLVFEEGAPDRTCTIYDLTAGSVRDLRDMLAHFVLDVLNSSKLTSVRLLLDGRHPARDCLVVLGFVPRPAEAVFLVHWRAGAARHLSWRITQGDKDT